MHRLVSPAPSSGRLESGGRSRASVDATAGALDTIAAIATPPGRGAIAIVRASGPDLLSLASRVFRSRAALRPRHATFGRVVGADGSTVDEGLALYFPGPHSVTGDDVLELHVHGSTAVARDTLFALLAAGARIAEPGEFTRRAYLNGKLDLSAAEAVGELIDAERTSAARAALGRVAGGLTRAVADERRALCEMLEELAASLDFPDEVAAPSAAELAARLSPIDARLATLAQSWERGRIVREGVSIAIVGPPNAGKSSLLNALLGSERALVSAIPGTTRDTIEETLALGRGIGARVVDTAGLRDTSDPLEAAGIERSEAALAEATLALVVVDASEPLTQRGLLLLAATASRPRVVFFNKCDLGAVGYAACGGSAPETLLGSAHDAGDVERLRGALAAAAGADRVDLARPYLGTARQASIVEQARRALARARETLAAGDPVDLVASELAAAEATLAELSGRDASEALLDGIFGRFCIGK